MRSESVPVKGQIEVTGGCEEIDFPDFIGVLFLKGNVSLDVSNRLEGILAPSFSDSGSLVSEKSIFSHRPVLLSLLVRIVKDLWGPLGRCDNRTGRAGKDSTMTEPQSPLAAPKAIPADSPEGKAFGVVYELSMHIRGPFMDQAIWIDVLIADIVTYYFCPDEGRRSLLRSEVFSGASSFSKNINLLKVVIEQSFISFKVQNPDLIKQLDELREFRNKLAHARLDTSPEWMAEGHTDRIRLATFKKGKAAYTVVTIEDSNKMLGKASVVLLQLVKLQAEAHSSHPQILS
jgi:hypothetical protein